MSAEIIVALIGGITAVIVAIITAIESSRRYTASKFETMSLQLADLAVKTNTLWEIYGEEVLRNARNAGLIASQSMEAPTAEWKTMITPTLAQQLYSEAERASRVLKSPYDVFVEVWQHHKRDLIAISRENNIPMEYITAGVLQICRNAVNS